MHRIVPALEQARETRGRKAKVTALATALRAVAADGEDDDLATAARVIAGIALPVRDGATLGVGYALVVSSACEAYGLSPADVHAKARALGDLGDAIGELAAGSAGASERPGLSLSELSDLAGALARVTDRAAKGELLRDAYNRARADQAKYLTKVVLGELRIGVREGTLEEAVAAAFGRSVKERLCFAPTPASSRYLPVTTSLHEQSSCLGLRWPSCSPPPPRLYGRPCSLPRLCGRTSSTASACNFTLGRVKRGSSPAEAGK